jgi:hypothetical protein
MSSHCQDMGKGTILQCFSRHQINTAQKNQDFKIRYIVSSLKRAN